MLSRTPEQLKKTKFKNSFGTLVEDINTEKMAGKNFVPIFMLRRLFYAVILVVLYPYPELQLMVIIAATLFPVKSICFKHIK